MYEISQMKNIALGQKAGIAQDSTCISGHYTQRWAVPKPHPDPATGLRWGKEFPGNSNVLGRQTCTGIFQEYQQNLICFLYAQRTERVIKQEYFALPSFTGVKSGFLSFFSIQYSTKFWNRYYVPHLDFSWNCTECASKCG